MAAEQSAGARNDGRKTGRSGRNARLPLAAAIAGVLAGAVATGAAIAAEPAPRGELGEVLVTATKREVSLQEVPVSITALSGEDLQRSGATAFADYATTVPNLSFGYAGAGRTVARQFQIRGLFGAGTSALYIDETPVPVTMDPRVLDVERIEVLRGPQGSLFGSRSMGGLVRMITKQPSTEGFAGQAHVRGGTIQGGAEDLMIDGSVNVPFADGRAAFRGAAYYIQDGGFVDRLVDPDASYWGRTAARRTLNGDERVSEDVNEDRTVGVQLAVRFQLTDSVVLTPSILYQKLESDGPPFVELSPEATRVVRQFDFDEESEDEWYLGSVAAEIDVGSGTIVSSTSYFDRKTADVEDGTLAVEPPYNGSRPVPLWNVGTVPVDTPQKAQLKSFTQELRYLSNGTGKVSYIAGLFYQHNENEGGYPARSILEAGTQLVFFGLPAGESFFGSASKTTTDEIGVFGELTYAFTPAVSATVGGRWYDYDAKANRTDTGTLYFLGGLTPPITSGEFKLSESGFNPKVGLDWRVNDDFMLYASAAKGFRPGGPNATATACVALGVANAPTKFDSDSVWSYEIGQKSEWLDDRMTANLSAYYVKWKDYRVNLTCPLGFGYSINTGEAESKGFELEIAVRPTPGLALSLAAGYTDAQIKDPGTNTRVRKGDPLVNVPEWTASAAIDHSFPLTPTLQGYWRADYRHVGSSVGLITLADSNGAIPTGASTRERPAYDLVNARLGLRFARVDAALYVDNLANERASLANPTPLSDALPLVAVNRPRTYGLELRYTF